MNFSYIYPPRPETKIAPQSLTLFERMNVYFAQPKLNGSSMEIYFNADGKEIKTMNRHKEPMECKIDKTELLKLYRGTDEMILCGEYLNKNQKDETGKPWNIKYVIWDIIMLNGKHLLGTTFEERVNLLAKLYPTDIYSHFVRQISENCYRISVIKTEFRKTYDDLTKYDIFEGLVLKRKDGKLENGTTEKNNMRTQIKCRKETKNYNF
jgi:hypothetical protein